MPRLRLRRLLPTRPPPLRPDRMITLDQLTSAQRTSLLQTADARGESINDYLQDLSPDPFMDNAIQGMLPHCELWGLMESDGRCHT